MTDISIGWGKVLRVRWLQASPTRKHLFRPKVETLSAIMVRAAKAQELLERRRLAWLEGLDDLSSLENEIRRLGYEFEDEPTADDGRYSYWRVK
jgi:hypothetical protein